MSIVVSNDAGIEVNGVDLSDHCIQVTVKFGYATTRDNTAIGDSAFSFRPDILSPSISATFWNDAAYGSVESTLRPLLGSGSSGFEVRVVKFASRPVSVDNPLFTMSSMIDGNLNLSDLKIGEVSQLSVNFLPYGDFTMTTASTTRLLKFEDDTGYFTLEDGTGRTALE